MGHEKDATNTMTLKLSCKLSEQLADNSDNKITLLCISGVYSGDSIRIPQQYDLTNFINIINKNHIYPIHEVNP